MSQPLFHKIAKKYDLANHVLSFGLDYYWRHLTATEVARCLRCLETPIRILDLATGSGDLAFALQKRLSLETHIIGTDISPEMLELACLKQKRPLVFQTNLSFELGSAESITCISSSIDAITIAFGIRNFKDRTTALKEIYRVLKKPTGTLWILEFSQPHAWLRPLHTAYLKTLMPLIGGALTGSFESYRYLNQSIKAFPNQLDFAQEIKAVGFSKVSYRNLTGGIVALYKACV